MKKILVLASGNGTNLQAVIDAIDSGSIKAEICEVISDREDAYALIRARNHGIEGRAIVRTEENREGYFDALLKEMSLKDPDLIVLAGFMKILPDFIINEFRNRIINIHPSLLPCFGGKGLYGMKVHRAVIDSGARVTGCTVHFASNDVDGGPIIEQRTMDIFDTDTAESLAERIHQIEHPALVTSISLVLEDNYRIEGKRVIFKK